MFQLKSRFLITLIITVFIVFGAGILVYAEENQGEKKTENTEEELTPIPQPETPATTEEEKPPAAEKELVVKAIEIQGNARILDEQILAVMVTRPGRTFVYSELEEDMVRIGEMGYFRTPPKYILEPMEGGVKVLILIEENPPFSGVKVKIIGPGLFKEEEIVAMFDIEKGEIIGSQRLAENYEKIEDAYRQKGYTAATIVGAEIDNQGVVAVEINEGIIKEFKVQGNTKTKSIVILRELTLKPGDVYDSVQFRRDLEKIFALQLFEDITVDYELTDDRQIIVIINVTEARTGQFGFGAGYSSQDGFLGEFTYTERNFRGMGQRVNLMGQIGGPNPDFMVSFYSPTIDKRGTSLTTEVFLLSSTDRVRNIDNPEEFTKFIMERKGGSIGFVRPLNETDDLSAKLSFLDGSIDVEGDVDPADYIEQLKDYMQRGLLEGTSNSVQLGFTRDTRDFALDPSEGFSANITGTYYGGLLGGDFDALKVSTEYRTYFKLNKEREQFVTGVSPTRFHKNHVIAFRIFLGGATGGLSLFDSFKVGGSDSVRGTEEALQTGDKSILANLEYRFPIITNLSGAIFIDSGTAAPPGESLNMDNVVTSVGGGIRYRIPFFGIAPLRLDYGYDIKNGTSRVTFGFGQIF